MILSFCIDAQEDGDNASTKETHSYLSNCLFLLIPNSMSWAAPPSLGGDL